MNIIARCPRCGAVCHFDGRAADRRLPCRRCGRQFKVPCMADVPEAERVIRTAKSSIYVDEKGKTYG